MALGFAIRVSDLHAERRPSPSCGRDVTHQPPAQVREVVESAELAFVASYPERPLGPVRPNEVVQKEGMKCIGEVHDGRSFFRVLSPRAAGDPILTSAGRRRCKDWSARMPGSDGRRDESR